MPAEKQKNSPRHRTLSFCLAGALAVIMVITLLMTYQDWLLNPSGLFHSDAGPNWPNLLETAWSWFWPLSLGAMPLAVAVALLFGFRAATHEGDEQK